MCRLKEGYHFVPIINRAEPYNSHNSIISVDTYELKLKKGEYRVVQRFWTENESKEVLLAIPFKVE